ncbi:hypothetical protein Pfo_005501 [Paulownia fortunei]|nr:hypothetical protein Pfo_005501 [Paulownia fortunei]
MQGSMANDLYSDILQQSSVELYKGSTAAQKDDNLHYIETSGIDREWERRRDQFHMIGDLDGLIAGKEAAAQEGFNIVIKDPVHIGYSWGLVGGITSFVLSSLKRALSFNVVTGLMFFMLYCKISSIVSFEYPGRRNTFATELALQISGTTNDKNIL